MTHNPNPNPIPWPDNNWVWQLFKGLPDTDLLKVTHNCRTNTADTGTRLASTAMVLFESMAVRCMNERQGIPPPNNVDPWPDSNWVFQLFRGLTNDDLVKVITVCRRQDLNEAARMVYAVLILCDAMSMKMASTRGLTVD